jgi:hypothetical protein
MAWGHNTSLKFILHICIKTAIVFYRHVSAVLDYDNRSVWPARQITSLPYPSYTVFIRQPHSTFPQVMQVSSDSSDQAWHDPLSVWVGDKSYINLGLEVYKFVSTPTNPCISDKTMESTHASVSDELFVEINIHGAACSCCQTEFFQSFSTEWEGAFSGALLNIRETIHTIFVSLDRALCFLGKKNFMISLKNYYVIFVHMNKVVASFCVVFRRGQD